MFVLRIFSGLTGSAALVLATAFLTPIEAQAACGSDALGTARTISVDPNGPASFKGAESALGLRDKEVILTFDDGPVRGNTPRILNTLADECVKATFFAVGRMAKANPRIAKRIVAQGHTLAHHTHTHDRLPNFKSARAGSRIDAGIAAVETAAYGVTTARTRIPFFRYPYLARNRSTDRLVRDRGLVSFGANIDARDWEPVSSDRVHNRIMNQLRREGRGIILMHDIQSRTARMLPRLLRSLKREGYRVVHMVPKGSAPRRRIEQPLVVAELETKTPAAKRKPLTLASAATAILNSPAPNVASKGHAPTARFRLRRSQWIIN